MRPRRPQRRADARRGRRRSGRGVYPLHLEQQYAARLLRRLTVARTLALETLTATDGGPPRRRDAEGRWGFGGGLQAVVEAVRRAFGAAVPTPEPEQLEEAAQQVDDFTSGKVRQQVEELVEVDVEGVTRAVGGSADEARAIHIRWARENVELIRTMERETFDDLAEAIAEATVEGRTDLAEVIQARFGVAENRARLIARDQIGKLNAQITRSRQLAMGITHYEWSSSGDQRVRPLHRKLDGSVRSWDDPHPTEGHPGQPIACRCVALPVWPPPEPEERPPEPPAEELPPLPQLPPTFGGLPADFGGGPRHEPGSIWVPGARVDQRRRR